MSSLYHNAKRENIRTSFPEYDGDDEQLKLLKARKIKHNCYLYELNGKRYVRFHQTDIVCVHTKDTRDANLQLTHRVVLNSGGHSTGITRANMNFCLRYFKIDLVIIQEKGVWMLRSRSRTTTYFDGIMFPSCFYDDSPDHPNYQQRRKQRRENALLARKLCEDVNNPIADAIITNAINFHGRHTDNIDFVMSNRSMRTSTFIVGMVRRYLNRKSGLPG